MTESSSKLADSKHGYGEISLLNHWVVGFLILALLVLGLVYDALPKSDASKQVIFWHASVGLLAIPFIIWRIVWRIKSGFPENHASPKQKLVARTVQWLLLIAIGLQIITGPMYLWTEAQPLPFFGLFEIPSPFAEEAHDLHEFVEAVHKYVANPLLLILLGLHFLGTLKRMFIDKKPTLTQ